MHDFDIGSPAHIAEALDGVREGNSWRCRCPSHDGFSLSVTESRTTGKLLFKCWAGCSFADIVTALREMDLVGSASAEHTGTEVDDTDELARRIRHAQSLFRRGEDAAGTIVQTYLDTRGITLLPEVLRFIHWCPHRNGHAYPAMVAPVVDVGGTLIGVTATFLRADGTGKADLPPGEQRQFSGTVKGGAVRLGDVSEILIVAEGIETAASCMQLFDLPAWAALSSAGIAALELPLEVASVIIAVDNDAAGQEAALSAYHRWKSEGRSVRLRMPTKPGTDFNDVLLDVAKYLCYRIPRHDVLFRPSAFGCGRGCDGMD